MKRPDQHLIFLALFMIYPTFVTVSLITGEETVVEDSEAFLDVSPDNSTVIALFGAMRGDGDPLDEYAVDPMTGGYSFVHTLVDVVTICGQGVQRARDVAVGIPSDEQIEASYGRRLMGGAAGGGGSVGGGGGTLPTPTPEPDEGGSLPPPPSPATPTPQPDLGLPSISSRLNN